MNSPLLPGKPDFDQPLLIALDLVSTALSHATFAFLVKGLAFLYLCRPSGTGDGFAACRELPGESSV
jgi:hypothetical protein